jgi:Transcription termination factor nusG
MPAYWAVLSSAPGHDILAYEGIYPAGFEILTPKIRTRVNARWKTNPLFGCYFFARIVDQWRVLERTVGVLSVVKAAGLPARCPDEEIATLMARSDADGIIRLNSRLHRKPWFDAPSSPGLRCRSLTGRFTVSAACIRACRRAIANWC